ncbi:MAG: tripartite tricarboxylate transporter substrate binding protein [Burkholderiales bacterium]|nr:tripartite tricarboxylate transporter substrate binding protein [Burkholderiales bacterium]
MTIRDPAGMTKTVKAWRQATAGLAAAVALGIACATATAADASYPTRPIRVIVGFPPGGGVDAVARLFCPKLAEALAQNCIVDNRPGAGGNVATELIARSTPDGHSTLVALSTQLTVNPALYKLSVGVQKDLQPVSLLNTAEHILVVHPGVPARSLKEFVDVAKQKAGALNYASAGIGSSLHMAAELLKKRTGIAMTHVAYKGAGPAVAALLASEVQVLAGTVVSMAAHINAGRLRALAVTGAARSKALPDLPTVAESGYPGFDADAWYALMLPAGTPAAIVERLRAEVHKALRHGDVQAAMVRQGLNLQLSSPAELASRIKTETAQWAGIIKDAGIRAE